MRSGDWSSDVCSSDLAGGADHQRWHATLQILRRVDLLALQIVGIQRRNRDRHVLQVFRRAPRSDDDFGDSAGRRVPRRDGRSEEHTSELQSLMRISYAVFCLKKKK